MREFNGYKKGINLGGWLSQCGEKNYNDAHYNSFIKEEDISRIAGWGVDHVRLPIDYNVLQTEDGAFIESGFRYVDNCIEWCRKNNLKMVFDIHKAKGYVFDNPEYMMFFDDVGLQDQFVALWEEIIRRYAGYKDMMAFELLNEITDISFAKKWNAIADRTVKAIRKIDQDVRIIIGGIYNSSIYGMLLLDPPADENIVHTIHVYSPMIFTHQSASWISQIPKGYQISYPDLVSKYREESLRIFGNNFESEFKDLNETMMNEKYFEKLLKQAVDRANEVNVPVYCGEYGVIENASPKDQLSWYQDINAAFCKFDMARAAWSYKQMDFGLSDERLSAILPEIKKYF